VLQICAIDLIHVGIGAKHAIQVYFPIREFQMDDFYNAYNNHILGMENFSNEKIIDNTCNLLM
jgi:hypothetical protein